jgi:hypothetical protein
VANVEKHGWAALTVGGKFCYSIGFTHTLKRPELIIFGLPSNMMHAMLSDVFDALRGGKTLQGEQRWDSLLEGFDCITRPVHETRGTR